MVLTVLPFLIIGPSLLELSIRDRLPQGLRGQRQGPGVGDSSRFFSNLPNNHCQKPLQRSAFTSFSLILNESD
jgi:hypothetical protein